MDTRFVHPLSTDELRARLLKLRLERGWLCPPEVHCPRCPARSEELLGKIERLKAEIERRQADERAVAEVNKMIRSKLGRR